MSDAKTRIMEALAGVTPEDLSAVTQEIEAVRAIAARQVAALQAVRSVMERQLGVETKDMRRARLEREARAAKPNPDGSRRKGAPPSDRTTAARKSAALLIAQNGPMMPVALAKSIGVPPSQLDWLMRHEWFGLTASGAHQLTPAGRQANC